MVDMYNDYWMITSLQEWTNTMKNMEKLIVEEFFHWNEYEWIDNTFHDDSRNNCVRDKFRFCVHAVDIYECGAYLVEKY